MIIYLYNLLVSFKKKKYYFCSLISLPLAAMMRFEGKFTSFLIDSYETSMKFLCLSLYCYHKICMKRKNVVK